MKFRGFLLLLSFSFCPGHALAESRPLRIEFWHSMTGAKGVLLAEIIKSFNDSAPAKGTIEVHGQFVGSYDEGLNKLRTSVLAGSEPHIVQITDIGAKVMMDSGRILPLQDLIDADSNEATDAASKFPLAEILPPIRHYYESDGRLQSLPFASSNPVLYFNADMFKSEAIEHPPTNFNELEQDAVKLTHADRHIQGITWPLHSWFVEEFVAKQGAVLFDHDNGRAGHASECYYTSPEVITLITLWKKMVDNGSFANVGRGWDPAEQNFLAGRTAMLITSTSDVFELSQTAPFHLGVAAIPGNGNHPGGGTVIGGNSLWLLRNKPREQQRAAFEFLKFMASAKIQEKWHTHTGYFPIRQDVITNLKQSGFYDKFPAAWVAIKQMEQSPDSAAAKGASVGPLPEAREHIMTAIEEILSHRLSIEAALQKAKAKTDNSLKRYNEGLLKL